MSQTRTNLRSLKEDYLLWLEPQLRDEHGSPSKRYWELLNVMFNTPFNWVIQMDENRVVDGKDLRMEFSHLKGGSNRRQLETSDFLLNMAPISFLEVLIALSRRMGFVAGGDPPGWAWQLLGNLELHRMSDPLTRSKHNKVQEILDAVMRRRYSPDGTGGFFPLAWPDEDQTKVELWYQMNAYIEELHPEH